MKKNIYSASLLILPLFTLLFFSSCNCYSPHRYEILVSSMDSTLNYDITHYEYRKNGTIRCATPVVKNKTGMTMEYFHCNTCHKVDKKTFVIKRQDSNTMSAKSHGSMYVMFFEQPLSEMSINATVSSIQEGWDIYDIFKNEAKGIPACKPYPEIYEELNAIRIDSIHSGVVIDIYSEKGNKGGPFDYSVTYLYD